MHPTHTQRPTLWRGGYLRRATPTDGDSEAAGTEGTDEKDVARIARGRAAPPAASRGRRGVVERERGSPVLPLPSVEHLLRRLERLERLRDTGEIYGEIQWDMQGRYTGDTGQIYGGDMGEI